MKGLNRLDEAEQDYVKSKLLFTICSTVSWSPYAAVELQPDHWRAIVHYGNTLGGQGHPQLAREQFNIAVQQLTH